MHKLKIASLFIIIVLFALLGFEVIRLSGFHVVRTNPSVNRVANVTPFFDIYFNKPIIKSSVSLTSSPHIISGYSVKGDVLDVSLSALTINKLYSLTLKSVVATNHQRMRNVVFHFTAKYINPGSLPKSEQQAIFKGQENYSSPANNPIVPHLPHQTLNYSLSAEINKGLNGKPTLTLQAELLLSQADLSNEPAAIAKDKQMVFDYIRSLGLNPGNYTINYIPTIL